MPDFLSSIQPALQPAAQVAGIGSTAYNLYNQYQNQQYQDQLRSFAQDPAKMNAYAAKFTQPLTAGLTAGVANQAQGDLATRGLTDSPEISQQVYAQAIAPYIQQNQQQGYQNALQALNLGGGAVNPNSQSPNSIAALAKAFASLPQAGSLNGPSALTRLLQLSLPGSADGGAPQPTTPDLGGTSIPDQSIDMSSFYQPDYSVGGGDSGYGANSD
jgi:hypothetical protein